MRQFDEIILFKGKNLADIFQEIYENHEGKKEQIKSLIGSLTPLVEGIGDATLLVPLIKEYLELGVKNDEQLVKLAQIVQRMEVDKKSGDSDFNFMNDLQGLLEENQTLTQEVEKTQEETKEVLDNAK